MSNKVIPMMTMRRLPVYLRYLHTLKGQKQNISSTAIAEYFGLNPVQVRKDLGAVSGNGRPKTGYDIDSLTEQLENFLGRGNETKTILVGAGNLGQALLSYKGFEDYGLNIIAAFDTSEKMIGTEVNGKPVLSIDEIEYICHNYNIKLGIITTPVEFAQSTCDRLIKCGIVAIWNFAPTILRAPEEVLIENENLASSLAILSKHLSK